MRKAISLVFAMVVLCFATSAMAQPTVDSESVVGRNADVGDSNTTTFYIGVATPTRGTVMPGFRPGDTINFTVKNITNSKELTVISYKMGTTPSDLTVQYINQYTISGNQPISYKIRDLASGIYCLKMTDSNDGNVATFYYKVGDVSVDMIRYGSNAKGTPYVMESFDGGNYYSIGFIGKATIDSADVGFGDIGANVGFTFSDNTGGTGQGPMHGEVRTKSGSDLDDYFNGLIGRNPSIELNGSFSVIYGVTVFNVPAANVPSLSGSTITASAYVND